MVAFGNNKCINYMTSTRYCTVGAWAEGEGKKKRSRKAQLAMVFGHTYGFICSLLLHTWFRFFMARAYIDVGEPIVFKWDFYDVIYQWTVYNSCLAEKVATKCLLTVSHPCKWLCFLSRATVVEANYKSNSNNTTSGLWSASIILLQIAFAMLQFVDHGRFSAVERRVVHATQIPYASSNCR